MSKKKYIVYVDDDIDDRNFMLESFPADSGYLLETFQNANELFDFLERLIDMNETPCLIVLDVNMPELNGWEVLKLLKENPKYANIQVIMFSTASRPVYKYRYEGHYVKFISKPNSYSQLQTFCKSLIDYCS